MDSREASESSSAEAPATPLPAATSAATVTAAATVVNPRTTTSTPTAKIFSRNANGTVVMTTSPDNEAELQLYRVMQRASLLAYYDTLLEMGGDDVQQLCDAGEEEFLEIMALVGMASKPLHVRRLQKALQEWVANPAMFQVALFPSVPTSPLAVAPLTCTLSSTPLAAPPVNLSQSTPVPPHTATPPYVQPTACPPANNVTVTSAKEVPRSRSPQCQFDREASTSPGRGPGSPLQLTPVLLESQVSRLAEAAEALVKTLPQFEPKPHNTKKKICRDLENVMTMSEDNPRRMEEIRKYAAIYGRFDCKRKPEKPLTLHEVSVNEAAAQICRFAPALLTRRDELFPLARQVVRDSGYHYSKTHSSLTPMYRSHHLSLRNGEEGYKRQKLDASSPPPCEAADGERLRRQDRLEAIADELRSLGERTEELVLAAQQVREKNDVGAIHSLQQQMEVVQNKQTQLLLEQSDLLKQPLPMRFYRRNSSARSGASYSEPEKGDTDDTDSQLSFSNTSSPSQEVGDSRDSLVEGIGNNAPSNGKPMSSAGGKGRQLISESLNEECSRFTKHLHGGEDGDDPFNDVKVQVISASGGNIIAVANPALSMSPAILPSTDALPCLRSDSPLSLRIERQSPKLSNPD